MRFKGAIPQNDSGRPSRNRHAPRMDGITVGASLRFLKSLSFKTISGLRSLHSL